MKSETNFKISQILFLNGFSHTEISYLHINTFSLSWLNQEKKYSPTIDLKWQLLQTYHKQSH